MHRNQRGRYSPIVAGKRALRLRGNDRGRGRRGRRRALGRRPAAAERLIELDDRQEPRQADLGEQVLRGEQGLLRLRQGDHVERALLQPLVRDVERLLRGAHHLALVALAQRLLLYRDQRLLDVAERRQHRLAVGLQQLELPAFRLVELAEQLAAVEERLRRARRHGVEPRARAEQRLEREALEAGLAGQLNGGKERGARRLDGEIRRLQVGLGLADVGALVEQVGRQPGRDARDLDAVGAAASQDEVLGRTADQHGERHLVLAQDDLERRDRGALLADQAFLLRNLEIGRGAGLLTLPDQVEDATGGAEILARDAQPVLRVEHVEIGVGDGDQRGERDHLLGVAGGDRGLDLGEQRRAVLAPEIERVARRQIEVVERGHPALGAAEAGGARAL